MSARAQPTHVLSARLGSLDEIECLSAIEKHLGCHSSSEALRHALRWCVSLARLVDDGHTLDFVEEDGAQADGVPFPPGPPPGPAAKLIGAGRYSSANDRRWTVRMSDQDISNSAEYEAYMQENVNLHDTPSIGQRPTWRNSVIGQRATWRNAVIVAGRLCQRLELGQRVWATSTAGTADVFQLCIM